MVACPVLCFIFSIFADSININGSFEKLGDTVINLAFIPFIIFFKIVDAVTSPFVEPEMREAIDNRDSLRAS
jgi:hypothetical protein